MALITNQNLFALTSQHYLAINQNALGKSIERLSSGLRINHASDDASGMAISEKMRGQISGLKRAGMNAQDGISYLQTAEGAMEQSASILQRMRELAVQASNGTYTTSDRAEIQKEVDQLKQELDRVSTATEFNARKLINGEGTALWSSSTERIQAIIRGPVPEGNYNIQMKVTPGVNEVQKSNIMTLKKGAITATIATHKPDNTKITNDTNITSVKDPESMIPTEGKNMTVKVAAGTSYTSVQSGSVLGIYSGKDSSWSAGAVTTTAVAQSGYYEVEVLSDSTEVDNLKDVKYRFRYIDPKTGERTEWVPETATEPTPGTAIKTLKIKTTNPANELDVTINLGPTGKIRQGDKLLLGVSQEIAAGDVENNGAAISISDPDKTPGDPVLVYKNGVTPLDSSNDIPDVTDLKIYKVNIDTKTGNINVGNITLRFNQNAGITKTGTLELDIRGGGDIATTSTRLKDLKQFIDADNNNIFDIPQELTIYGNGKKALIHIEGNDTIATLVEKLKKAIIADLGMGSDDPNVNNNLVRYITVPDEAGIGTVPGTIIMQTAMTGENSKLSIIGNQPLINAFGFAVQKPLPQDNETTVTIRNAHTGEIVGTEVTGNDRIYTILEGVEIALDSRTGLKSKWDQKSNSIIFESDIALKDKKYFLHLVDNRTSLQIGANKGQDLDVSIPQLDLKGLGLENMTMISQEKARKAIGLLDSALTRVVSARATVGAQVSRLEYTIQNLSTARQNLSNAESRIRDLDVAEESSTLARNQILVQSGIAMLAQANQIPQSALKLLQG